MPRRRPLAYGSTHARAPPRPRSRRPLVRPVLHRRTADRDVAREPRDTPPCVSRSASLRRSPSHSAARYPLAAFLVSWRRVRTMVTLAPAFDDQSAILVVVFVFALYSFGANARGARPGRRSS